MLRLAQRTLVGQSSINQNSGVLLHPTQEIFALYSIVSEHSTETFLTYFKEQLEHSQPQTTLEFHQLLDRCIATAERMQVELSLVSIGLFDQRVVLAAYQASIWLKRGPKAGPIVTAEKSLQLLEGNAIEHDVYVLLTQEAHTLAAVIGSQLANISPLHATNLIDLPQISAAIESSPREAQMGVSVLLIAEEVIKSVEPLQAPMFQNIPQFSAAPVVEPRSSTTPAELAAEDAAHTAKLPVQPPIVLALRKGVTFLIRTAQQLKGEVIQLSSPDVYVRRRQRKTLGRILIFAVVLLFTVIGTFAFLHSRQVEEQKQVQAIIQPFATQFSQIQQIQNQNPVVARQQAERLISDLEAQSQLKNKPAAMTKAFAIELDKVRQFYQSISGQEQRSVLPTFFDLTLVQANFLASAIDTTPDTLFFLDSGQKKILALTIDKKQPTVLPIGDAAEIRAIIADEKYLYFLGQGLFRFTLSGTDVAKLVENPDDTLKNGSAVGIFGSYAYVLNKSQNNIFRYTTNDDQLNSKPVTWVQSSQGMDFTTAQSLSIDGDIWIGTQQGEIKKFTSGKQVDFTVSGLKEAFSTPIKVFTKPDLLNLYILEPQKSRVVVLNKKGEFLKEIQSSTLAGSTSIVASEKFNKAFALSGSLVFEINL